MTYRTAYDEVRELVEAEGGEMEFHQGGAGGGGDWVIDLRGATTRIKCTELNSLDSLYRPKNPNQTPVKWDDYSEELVDEALSKLDGIVGITP